MPADIKALTEERLKLLDAAGKLLDKSKANGNRWTAEDETEFTRLHDAAEGLYTQIQAARTPDTAALTPSRRATPTGRMDGFAAYLRHGVLPSAGLQTDLDGWGGYFAPPRYVQLLAKGLDDGSWFRRLCTVRPATTAPEVVMPSRASRPAVAWGQELATPPDSGFKLGVYKLIPHYMTGEVEVSIGAATAPGGEQIVMDEIRAAAAALEEKAFVAGDGARKPLGLFTPSDAGVPLGRDFTGPIDQFATWADARLSLRSVYLRSPSLRVVMHPSALRVLTGVTDSAGQPVWVPASRPGDQDHLHGVPIELTDDAPTGTGSGGGYQSGDYFAAIGDLAMYDVQDGTDLYVNRMADSGYTRRGVYGYIFRRKVDGGVRAADAFTRLKVA